MRLALGDGRVLDWIMALMLAESAGLAALYRLRGRGVAPSALLPNLAAGAFLLLAMRLALAGARWWLAPCCLLAALAMHAVDLLGRWK